MTQKRLVDRDDIFSPENIVWATTAYSDRGEYKLEIAAYKVGTSDEHYWNYTRAVLYHNETAEKILEIRRNYSSFWHLFINHPNGNQYLVFSRNYHGGYSVFDITNRHEYIHDPEGERKEYVSYFCWVDVDFFEEDQELRVEGCYWGAPFEIVIFDFSNPTQLPLPEKDRYPALDESVWDYDPDDPDDCEDET